MKKYFVRRIDKKGKEEYLWCSQSSYRGEKELIHFEDYEGASVCPTWGPLGSYAWDFDSFSCARDAAGTLREFRSDEGALSVVRVESRFELDTIKIIYTNGKKQERIYYPQNQSC